MRSAMTPINVRSKAIAENIRENTRPAGLTPRRKTLLDLVETILQHAACVLFGLLVGYAFANGF